MSEEIKAAWATLEDAMKVDPDYAWGWHCNLAMPVMDAIGCTHQQANEAAAHLMAFLFGVDITGHPHYAYGKSDAQFAHEFRIEMDRVADAEIAAAPTSTGNHSSEGE